MTRSEIQQQLYPGSCWDITNHYITRPEHPCFGTRRVVISERNGTSFYTVRHPLLVGHHEKGSRIEWPKASQMERDEDGTIRLFGGGIGQGPGELFLTLTPADRPLPFVVKCDDCGGVVRWCETSEESAVGGRCDSCREKVAA